MAKTSTREKIRFQAQKAIDTMDRPLDHLQSLDALAAGQSPYINDKLPVVVGAILKVKELLEAFRINL